MFSGYLGAVLRHRLDKAQRFLGTRHYDKALHVTKGTTLNVKPQVHPGSRQAVRNAKFCACLHVPVARATEVPPIQAGGDLLLSVGRLAEGRI